jgi:hypothetical protein
MQRVCLTNQVRYYIVVHIFQKVDEKVKRNSLLVNYFENIFQPLNERAIATFWLGKYGYP